LFVGWRARDAKLVQIVETQGRLHNQRDASPLEIEKTAKNRFIVMRVSLLTPRNGFVYFPRFKGDAKFLYYVFASGEPYRGLGKLGTQLNLNTDIVGSIVAGFPKLVEQCAIAAFLDRETGRVERLVAKKREFIERLQE